VTTPHLIEPNAVYGLEAAQQALGLKQTTLRTEIRRRRLRVAKRAGRFFLLGAWLLEWIQAGEIRRPVPADPACACPADRPERKAREGRQS